MIHNDVAFIGSLQNGIKVEYVVYLEQQIILQDQRLH